MKTTIKKFTKIAKLIRCNETYSVYDYKMEHLLVSMTVLHTNKCTTGHSHKNQEEVYIFIKGKGRMQLGKKRINVKKDDIITIKKGSLHKIFNKTNRDLVFLSIFEKYKGR